MVLVMHQQKSQQMERAKWTFSWEHSPDLKAPSYFPSSLMSLTARGGPSRPLSSPDKPSLAQISTEGRARELQGGGFQERVQMLGASWLVWQELQRGVGEQWRCKPGSESNSSSFTLEKKWCREVLRPKPLLFATIILLELWFVLNLLQLHVISNHQSGRPQKQADCGRVGPPFNWRFTFETL